MVVAKVIGDLSIGGAERLFVNLCNALEADKTLVILTGGAHCKSPLLEDLRPDIEVHYVRVRHRSWIWDVWKLSRLLRRAGCDVVHTHMFWPNLAGTIAARLARVPVIVTSEHGRNEWKRAWHRWLEMRVISRYADARLCVSQDILRRRRDDDGVPEQLLRMVPNGTVVPEVIGHERQQNLIGSVGRLVDAKDYPTLVRAIAILKERGEDVRLEIVGDGPERKTIEAAIAREGVGTRISLVGTQTNVGDWLARWSLFVSSSVREGQPLALLEAMAAGLPGVVTAVGGVPDTLADGVEGFVVPSNDPEALALGIQRLLGDEELRSACGQAARERVIRDFSIASLANTCSQLYSSVLQAKRVGEAA
jgi:glycosyltransferase involved in cell wall biosynthesis